MDLRTQIIETARAMNRSGLNQGTSGNVSARVPGSPTYLITPTGMSYDALTPDDLVELDLAGRVISGHRAPSSEWRLHQEILHARPEVGAVVHTHSMHAVALACTRRPIPAFHYMVAVAGGTTVPCAEYATYGTSELARNVVAALQGRTACLMANHGMVALGPDLGKALRIAEEIETLAAQYWRALLVGPPVILDDAEMARVLERFASYGQQPGPRRTG